MSLPIAIQLYSVRDTMQNDPEGTLVALKEMGYCAVEVAGFYGRTAQELRALCEQVGLEIISSHIGFPSIRDELDKHIEESVSLGVRYVAIAYMHTDFHIGGVNHDGVYESIKEISARFREKGITLLYHNHSFEMCEHEGKRLYEWLFDAMTREELQPEIDTGWIDVEVGEAEQYIRKFKNRCDIVHLKSYYGRDGYDELVHSPDEIKPREYYYFCNFERGRLDVPAILAASEESGAKWIVVEQDRPDPGLSELESARINIEFLKNI